MLGKRLKELRLKKGYTQQQLGNMVNVTKVSICCYENDIRTPNLETFQDLSRALGTTPNYLLGNDIDVISDNDGNYSIRLSKEEIEIINQLKLHNNLYKKLINDPKRTVELIAKRMQ